MKFRFLIFLFALPAIMFAQGSGDGLLTGNLLTESRKAVEGATVTLVSMTDSSHRKTQVSDRDGQFRFEKIAFGYYRLQISHTSLQSLRLDSIWFRKERFDFNMNDIVLKPSNASELAEVVIYSEKPLVESKDGNITFNASESAVAAGSNASDLLNNVPLVAKDANGKITVRGKEPKILIDDKPVELNLQQLQDLLESMPGSSVEKIEVMTNPPPQYANEQGGVINIVTRKGRVGRTGRINLSAGSRGEVSLNGNFSYRRQGLNMSINAGMGYNRIRGAGHSERTNMYADSTNSFQTKNEYLNRNWRPNFRFNIDYDLNKQEAINFVLHYNQNDFENESLTEYRNINRFGNTYRLSERSIESEGRSYSPNANLTYTRKGKLPGETLRLIGGYNVSFNDNGRRFFQQFFFPDHTPNGVDSLQQQETVNRSDGYNIRVNYDRPLRNKKTFFSAGTYITRNNSDIEVQASYFKKPEQVFVASEPLSNDFKFHQTILNLRGSVRQVLKENFSFTAGTSVENTRIWFELFKDHREARNDYWTWLPFANLNRNWKEKLNLTLSYRRTIRRPGINELNPTIDFGDPYNVRFGNERLEASTAHNFDLVAGRNKTQYHLNAGLGYNIVEDVFSQVRSLLPDGKTQITWQNISGRREYELSSWGGLTINKKIRANLSASYTYNAYSRFDKTVNRYRDGGSFTSNINGTYTPKDVLNFSASLAFNRFANPQGFARWSWSMNLGIQQKLLEKKLVITLNIIDPFVQETRNYTYGPNFILQSFNRAQTRNFRLTAAYNISRQQQKKSKS